MKRILVAALIGILTVSLYAFKTTAHMASEVLQKLGIPEEIAKDCIWSSFSGGYLSYPDVNKLKRIASGERPSIVREVGEYAKKYSQSEEFKNKYMEYREGRKPSPPEAPKPMAQLKKEQKEQLQTSIRETETSIKSMPADQQEMMKGIVKTLKEQLKSIDDPKNPMFSPEMEKMQQQGHEAAMKEYKERLVTWEKENPTTPNEMVKHWLTEFLNESKDVDFSAALMKGDGGKMYFAKTEYERKSSNWKMCYRSGKETVEAGRTFAKQWLEELNKAK